jgi:hypothetical protein
VRVLVFRQRWVRATPRSHVRGRVSVSSRLEPEFNGALSTLITRLLQKTGRITAIAPGISDRLGLRASYGGKRFTRAVALRDAQLSDYAANLERKADERTRELDERNRGMRLVLDNVAQGFITIASDGVMAAERSAVVDRWFGTPSPGITLGLSARARGDLRDLARDRTRAAARWLLGLSEEQRTSLVNMGKQAMSLTSLDSWAL